MFPKLFEFEWGGRSLTIHSYGLFIALGAALWLLLVHMEASRRAQESLKRSLTLVLLSMAAAGWLGGKLFYVLTVGGNLRDEILQPSGFVYQGSLLAAVGTFWFLSRWLRLSPWSGLDTLLTPAPLLHTLGRIGCFLAGCCYGRTCELPWAVHQGHDGALRHPVQLYEAACELLLFLVLWFGIRPRQRFKGQMALNYLSGYGLIRLITELFRGDEVRGFVAGLPALSMASLFSILMILGSWLLGRRLSRSEVAQSGKRRDVHDVPPPEAHA